MKTFFIFALLAFSMRSVYALDCNNATTQADINQCANAGYKKADAQLNKAYREVYSRVDATRVPQLKVAQNAWIRFRDADCSFQTSSARGGSMYASVLASCLEGKTSARTKELSALLHCTEGDTTCVFSGNWVQDSMRQGNEGVKLSERYEIDDRFFNQTQVRVFSRFDRMTHDR